MLRSRRTRCRLPVAVDITASFVEIMLNDAYLNPETESPRSDNELRLMYAMAVVRLVNGIVDWFSVFLKTCWISFKVELCLLQHPGRLQCGATLFSSCNETTTCLRTDKNRKGWVSLNVHRDLNGHSSLWIYGMMLLTRSHTAIWWKLMILDSQFTCPQNLPSLPVLRLAAQEAVWPLGQKLDRWAMSSKTLTTHMIRRSMLYPKYFRLATCWWLMKASDETLASTTESWILSQNQILSFSLLSFLSVSRLLVERFWRPQLHQIEERGAWEVVTTINHDKSGSKGHGASGLCFSFLKLSLPCLGSCWIVATIYLWHLVALSSYYTLRSFCTLTPAQSLESWKVLLSCLTPLVFQLTRCHLSAAGAAQTLRTDRVRAARTLDRRLKAPFR